MRRGSQPGQTHGNQTRMEVYDLFLLRCLGLTIISSLGELPAPRGLRTSGFPMMLHSRYTSRGPLTLQSYLAQANYFSSR